MSQVESTPASAASSATPLAATSSVVRSLSIRSIGLALAIAVGGAAIASYHDGAIANREMVLTRYTAPVYIALFFGAVLIMNGVAALWPRVRALSAREMGVTLALLLMIAPLPRLLANGWVGTVGFMPALLDARHSTVAPLQPVNPYDALPDSALLSLEDSRQFERGLRPGEVAPWRAWLKPAVYWAPLLGVFVVLSVSFGYMLYRQWAVRELVPFPLAELGGALVMKQDGRVFPDVFYRPAFWMGWGLVVGIFSINGLHAHIDKMIEIPTTFSYYELAVQFPFLKESHEGYSLLRGALFITIVAVAVLLPAEISFTSWATWPVMVVGSYLFFSQTGRRYTGADNGVVMMGAFWAMALLILYAGRTFYLNLLRCAVGWPGRERPEPQSIWAARLFLASCAALVLILWRYGIPPELAVLWTLCTVMMFLVVCRLVAEMGIPWTPLGAVGPLAVLASVVGHGAMGAKVYALLSVFNNLTTPWKSGVFLIAPAVLNGAHVEARTSPPGSPSATARVLGPFMLVVLVLCVSMAVWTGYQTGSGDANDYPSDAGGINEVATAARQLATSLHVPRQGDGGRWMEAGAGQSIAQRWANVDLQPRFVGFFLFGFALVMATGIARLKFPRFPLHPLPLVLLGSWLMSRFWGSFLIGWLIKQGLLKCGGAKLFERSRPFWVGAVAGQAVIFTVWVVVNIVIYRNNNLTFDPKWLEFLHAIYSM